MNDKLELRFAIYDSLLNAYNELLENEKVDFEIGLTMLYNYDFYKKYKKSNIRFGQDLVLELFNLSIFCIKLNNYTGIMNYQTIFTKSTLEIIDKSFEGEFSELTSKKDYNVLFSFIKVLKSMLVIIASNVAKTDEEFMIMNKKIEAGYNAIQNRFNVDYSRTLPEINNVKSTISLKHNHKLSITKLRRNLIREKFITGDKNIDVKFEAIFGNYEVKESDRIVWRESNHALKIFLDFIKGETDIKQKLQLYKTATKCFVKEDYQEFEYQKIQNSTGSSHLLIKIEEIVHSSLNSRIQK